ncbi:hypothetical protein MRX96_009342 [Rhipicephalus microplus]
MVPIPESSQESHHACIEVLEPYSDPFQQRTSAREFVHIVEGQEECSVTSSRHDAVPKPAQIDIEEFA